MGWQDRDYARVSPRPTWSGQRRGWLIGGSIVTTLLAVNVIVYVLGALSPDLRVWLYSLGAMQAQAVVHGQVWRLLTAQYLHAGTGHLFINMLVLHFLGRSLERMWSPRKLFLGYTRCGLCG
ncbi:MAG: rhomboid family intramembrane serine protease, partial [Planctomycetes bacterium]|nr:rhomboid family intramembrane serine protease [Planctomycetota bacterium]